MSPDDAADALYHIERRSADKLQVELDARAT